MKRVNLFGLLFYCQGNKLFIMESNMDSTPFTNLSYDIASQSD